VKGDQRAAIRIAMCARTCRSEYLTQCCITRTITRVMSLRRTFAFVLLAALALTPCLGVCEGWSASGDARMACCADKSANEAKMCCAASEGRQNADGATALTMAALAPFESITLKIATALVPRLRAEAVIDSHHPITDDSARYVLLSVFLI